MVAAAVVGSSVVGAGASIYGSGKASKAAVQAQELANQVMQEMYNTTRSDLMPFQDFGKYSTNLLQDQLPSLIQPISMSEADLQETPGYKFTLDQGLKSIQRTASARGLGVSGAALKGAEGYATGLADSTYQTRFGEEMANKEFTYNSLLGGAQLGENAAAQTGAMGTTLAGNMGANIMQAGSAQAAAAMNSANAVGQGANNISGIYLLNALLKNQGGKGILNG